MNLGFGLSMDMRMEQKLSPQMIQSLKLLQVSALELEMLIKQEMEMNPVLELDDGPEPELVDGSEREERPEEREPEHDPEADEKPDEPQLASSQEEHTEIDWEAYFDDGFDLGGRMSEERSDPDEHFERVPVHQKSMEETLMEQLDEKHFDQSLRPIVEWLIGNLNENGFLEATKEETQAKLSIDESTWEEALSVLQWLDPAGIGARDLRECLLIQLSRDGMRDSVPWKVVHDCFGLLQKLKIPTIARRLDCTPEDVQAAIKEIGQLEPRPGRQLSSPQAPTVVPDLVVDRGPDGFWFVGFNDKTVPSLRVSRSYADMVRRGSKASTDEKKYVRDKLNSATWLLRSIEQRKGTMLKVMHAILESQIEFFELGPGHLKPLVLQDIADKVKMHISTVSRVTNEKYVQTPHGVFELKSFFSASVTQEDGTEISSVEAREAIKRLIESEDPAEPLSDQKIVDVLEEQSLHVARRTVAKYRDLMGILPARMRRKF
ncbi:MAG: RNA polymerase factor sigma-54 [Fibrobacterota bacterium]